MNNTWRISRRSMLRSLGAALALPSLDAMRAHGGSQVEDTLKVGYLYIPNGVAEGAWQPASVDASDRLLKLNPWMSPLEPFKKDILIPENMWTPRGNGHSAGTATWLTGGSYDDIRIDAGGTSVDQLAARKVGHGTMLPSLELSLEGEGFFSNSLPRNTLSWANEQLPASRETRPRMVFDRMFRRAGEGRVDRSVLDLVMDQSRSLKRRLGRQDGLKIDEYLDAVRAVERRIEFAEKQASRYTHATRSSDLFQRPVAGIPADHAVYVQTMMDLMVLAFWSGATRVCTFMLDHGQSNRYFNFIDGVQGTWHALSHWKDFSGKTEDDDGVTSWASRKTKLDMYNTVTRWHHQQVAYLLERMQTLNDGEGSLLDHSMLLYGSSLADGHEHESENLPLMVLGQGCGTINSGRRIRYRKKRSLSAYHLATLQRLGAVTETFAETSDPMGELQD
ncbi:DUF1552 domain-containing protein [bacterium]|jgi:hypothetical protein|nr:DUF1552 domain-containing protein [bacterium]